MIEAWLVTPADWDIATKDPDKGFFSCNNVFADLAEARVVARGLRQAGYAVKIYKVVEAEYHGKQVMSAHAVKPG